MVLTLLWVIWFARNAWVFDNVSIPVNNLVELAQQTLIDHRAASDALARRSVRRGDGK